MTTPVQYYRDKLQWWKLRVRERLRTLRASLGGHSNREMYVLQQVRAQAKPGDAESVLRVMDDFGRHRQFLMNVGDEKGTILDQAVYDAAPTHALELGCYCGYSAIRIARILKKQGRGHLTSIERSPDHASVAKQIIDYAGLSDYVTILVGTGAEMLPTIGTPLELVFIDHAKEHYLADLKTLENANLLKPGSIVVADNVGIFSDTLEAYLDYVRSCGHYSSKHFPAHLEYYEPITDAVEVSRRL